jgi:hypothetical protein
MPMRNIEVCRKAALSSTCCSQGGRVCRGGGRRAHQGSAPSEYAVVDSPVCGDTVSLDTLGR